jgi:proteasome accessory factor B
VRAHLHAVVSDEPQGKARVRVREGAGYWLRRRAASVAPDGDGWDVLDLPYADEESLGEELTSYGASVVALDPPELAAAVARRLTAVAAGSSVNHTDLSTGERT